MTAARPARNRSLRHGLTVAALLLGLAALSACLPLGNEAPPDLQGAEETPPPDSAPLRPAVIRQIQSHLAALGYAPGPRDGVVGPQTAAAIEAYQRDRRLPVDGRISAGLVADLEAERAGAIADARVKALPQAPKPRPDGVALAPRRTAPPPPRYLPGTRYLYANGDVQEVLTVDGEEIRWQSNDGETTIRSRNFMLPPLSRANGEISANSTLDQTPDVIWRQSASGGAAFTVATEARHGGGPESVTRTEEQWRCRQEGAARISVIAGRFDTIEMVCERLTAAGTPELARSWFYAPALGHFVRREDRILSGAHGLIDSLPDSAPTLELVAVQPAYLDWPPAALGGLDRAIRHVLDTLPDGATLDWRSSAVAGEIALTAGESLALDGRPNCRRLGETWEKGQEIWRFPRLACRGPDGSWQFQGEQGRRLTGITTPATLQAAAAQAAASQ